MSDLVLILLGSTDGEKSGLTLTDQTDDVAEE